jgi:hypothetical protein
MVDRSSRRTAGELLRLLVAGQITNDEFEDRMPRKSPDLAICEIFFAGWCLYSDQREYRLVGKHRVSSETRHHIALAILFLQTDLEYEWPCRSMSQTFVLLLGSLLTLLGYAGRVAHKRFARSGDFDMWPFIRRSDYESARNEPRFLNGVV